MTSSRAPRRAVASVVPALLAGLLAGALGACQDGTTSASRAGDLPECSADGCAGEVAAYGEALAALPEVQDVREIGYEPEQITDVAGVSGAVQVADAATCQAIEEDLGRLLWQSQVFPVGRVQVLCYVGSASGSDYEYSSYSLLLEDADDLTARWGPRGG